MTAIAPQLMAHLLKFLHPYYFGGGGPTAILGILFLAMTRDFLFENRIHDYNTPEHLHYRRPEPCGTLCDICTPEEIRFRTLDGHCNNLNQTGMGMKNHRYGRSALKDARIPDPGLFEPDPYLVAEKLLKTKPGTNRTVGSPYNMWMTSWINFNIHDWMFHDTVEADPYTLQWGPSPNDTFKLRRTFVDKQGYTINTETPWWDASQLYGTSKKLARSLRDNRKCELRLDSDGDLPLGPDGIPEGGFVKNWWAGVEIMHNMFAKEHNYVCAMLRNSSTSFSEEELYQTARLVVAGVQARIHTLEWTPALLNNEVLNVSMHNNWVGLQPALELDTPLVQTLLSKLGSTKFTQFLPILDLITKTVPGMGGVGYRTELSNVPYSFSEDFVSAYRMHPFIPDEFTIDGEKVATGDMINQKARGIIKKYGASKLVDAWGHQPPTTLTLHNYPDFLTNVTIPGENGPRNMAAVDIFRDRERGMVRYNQARRQYGIGAAKTFEDITDNPEWAQELRSVYKSVEDVDFLVGCLAESPRPTGYLISNTAFYIFIMNASRRLLADRFFQEAYNEDTYTKEGFAHVEGATLKTLILRHHPELKDSVGNVTNAFFDWTGTPLYGDKNSTS